MIKIIALFILVQLSTIALPQNAFSAEEGGYLGLGIGQVNVAHDTSKITSTFPSITSSASLDDSNYGLRMFAGYWFDPYLGMELSFQDVPTFNATENGNKTSLYGMEMTSLVVITRKSIWEHEVFAKAGLSEWRICSGSNCGQSLESGQNLVYGAGINFNLYDSKTRTMRIEWEHSDIDSIYLKQTDVISLNIVFNFGGLGN